MSNFHQENVQALIGVHVQALIDVHVQALIGSPPCNCVGMNFLSKISLSEKLSI